MKTDALQKRIYRYLLGDLPQEEQSALEQDFLGDEGLFEEVWAAENELIDCYVRGRLTPAEKALFERNYLASPVHRERLVLSQNLVRAADSSSETRSDEPRTARADKWRSSVFGGWKSIGFRWATSVALVLFAAGTVWLISENRRLREQINQTIQQVPSENRIKELEKELQAQREKRDELVAELAALREQQSATVETQPQDIPSEQRSVASFLLSPLLMRSGNEPQELKLPNDANAALLRMRVERADGDSFQASLRTVDGAQVWSRSGIEPRSQNKSDFRVSVSIPASKIPPGDYILTLSAIKANELEEVNRYFFRVIKQ